jgi:Protein of unknown function (DUF4876)
MRTKSIFNRLTLLATAFLLLVSSCDDDDKVKRVPVDVHVVFPENYNKADAEGVDVTLVSKTTSETQKLKTDATGKVQFTEIVPGDYSLSAALSLTATQAVTLTGIEQALELNASNDAVLIALENNATVELTLAGSRLGNLVIKEMYYTGSKTASGGNYFSDQFIEIYNNSTEDIYLDGLLIGDVYGNAGLINPTSPPTSFGSDANNSYVSNIWRIPGTGQQHKLEPGKSVIIAQDGIDHKTDPNGNPNSPVNLGNAKWETYNQRDDNRDLDAPGVPNLERVYFTGGFDWLVTVFGPTIIIFRSDNVAALEQVEVPGSPALSKQVKVPNNLVIDAFQALKDGSSSSFKRVPTSVDAGFTFATGTYTSESSRRKVKTEVNGRKVLQDTNNSTVDFELISKPTPGGF